MTDELGPEPHELQEQALEAVKEVQEELSQEKVEQLQGRQWLNQIGLSTAILSALAAIAAMQAGSLANEGMMAQIRSTDLWNLYQARSTKSHVEQSTVRLLQALEKPVPSTITAEIKKLDKQQQENQTEARKLELESQLDMQRHELFARSVAALQIGISLGAVAALLRKRSVWYLGLGIAAIGVGFMIFGTAPVGYKTSIGEQSALCQKS